MVVEEEEEEFGGGGGGNPRGNRHDAFEFERG